MKLAVLTLGLSLQIQNHSEFSEKHSNLNCRPLKNEANEDCQVMGSMINGYWISPATVQKYDGNYGFSHKQNTLLHLLVLTH